MSEALDPNDRSIDLVDAYRLHSEEGIVALKAIIEGRLKSADTRQRRETVERVLDLLHNLVRDYEEIAHELASKNEFPDRAERWPALFGPPSSASVKTTGGN